MKRWLAIAFLTIFLAPVFAQDNSIYLSPEMNSGRDLVLLLDSSASVFTHQAETADFITGPFIQKRLAVGDTIHLLTFDDSVRVEFSRRIDGPGDIKAFATRVYSILPLGSYTDLSSSIAFLHDYIASLPAGRILSIVIISDGIAETSDNSEVNARSRAVADSDLADLKAYFYRHSIDYEFLNLPLNSDFIEKEKADVSDLSPNVSNGFTDSSYRPSINEEQIQKIETLSLSDGGDSEYSLAENTESYAQPDYEATATEDIEQALILDNSDYIKEETKQTSDKIEQKIDIIEEAPTLNKSVSTDKTHPSGDSSSLLSNEETVISAETTVEQNFSRSDEIKNENEETTWIDVYDSITKKRGFLLWVIIGIIIVLLLLTFLFVLLYRHNKANNRTSIANYKPPLNKSKNHLEAHQPRDNTADLLAGARAPRDNTAEFLASVVRPRDNAADLLAGAQAPRDNTAEFLASVVKPRDNAAELLSSFQTRREGISEIIQEKNSTKSHKKGSPKISNPVLKSDFIDIPDEPIIVKKSGRLLLRLWVKDQNPNIGRRNTHIIKAGQRLSLGGGSSDFLLFLVPFPKRIADIRYDGETCILFPKKMGFFDIEGSYIPDCIGKNITVLSQRGIQLELRFELFEDPLTKLNLFLHSIDIPG